MPVVTLYYNLKQKTAMKTIYTLACLILVMIAQAQPIINQTNEIKSLDTEEETVMLVRTPARFSYLPNMDAYFDSHENLYIFQQNGQWVKAREIPSGYRGYSIYNGARIELAEYNGDKPYTLLSDHQKQYPKQYNSKR